MLVKIFLGRPKPQRRRRNLKHIKCLLDLYREISGHPRHKFLIGIGHVDNYRVIDHVLQSHRLQPHLPNGTIKHLVHICVDLERDFLSHFDLADIGFVNAGLELHLGKVIRNGKQGGGAETGCHGLPDIYIPRNDYSRNRSDNRGITQVDIGPVERRLYRPFVSLSRFII